MADAMIRDSFEMALQEALADAMTLVWKMQNATTEQQTNENLTELEAYAYLLSGKASVILGHVVRWRATEALWGTAPGASIVTGMREAVAWAGGEDVPVREHRINEEPDK